MEKCVTLLSFLKSGKLCDDDMKYFGLKITDESL
jgi:hypothetical protein